MQQIQEHEIRLSSKFECYFIQNDFFGTTFGRCHPKFWYKHVASLLFGKEFQAYFLIYALINGAISAWMKRFAWKTQKGYRDFRNFHENFS